VDNLCITLALLSCALGFLVLRKPTHVDHPTVVELKRRMDLLDEEMSSVTDRLKKTSARLAGRARREQEAEESEKAVTDTAQQPGETAEAWKQRMRLLIQTGKLKAK